MRLADVIAQALRAARVPAQVTAKALSHVDYVEARYKIYSVKELANLHEWELWLVLIKSLLSQLTKTLRKEGYCHANYYVIGALVSIDERIATLIRRWVLDRCNANNDPCCSNPRCCNLG